MWISEAVGRRSTPGNALHRRPKVPPPKDQRELAGHPAMKPKWQNRVIRKSQPDGEWQKASALPQ